MTRAEALYERLPIPFQNLAISYQGWLFERRRSDRAAICREMEFLRKSETWSAEEFLAYQTVQLDLLLKHCFSNIPYYVNLKDRLSLDLSRPPFELLNEVPVLEKAELREKQEQFVDPRIDRSLLIKTSTSGTTGTPLTIYQTQESVSKRFSYVARLRDWAGLSDPVTPKRAQFTGRSIVPRSQKPSCHIYWRDNVPNRARLFSTVHIQESTAADYIRALREFDPELIDGYPSAILVLARLCTELKLEPPKPKAIIVSAETVLPEHRSIIESVFGCRLYDQYAGSEPSCFWMDCEHGHMHMSPEHGVSEVLGPDGNPASPGQSGDIVLTSFLNPVMPLLRYRIGDSAVVGPAALCACGRHMPRIERIEGRLDDILYVPERGYVGRLDPVFKGLAHIVEAQIIQERLDAIRILLVPAKDYTETIGNKLVQQLREKVGESVRIDIDVVESIPRGPNGKFRSVISRCRDTYPMSNL